MTVCRSVRVRRALLVAIACSVPMASVATATSPVTEPPTSDAVTTEAATTEAATPAEWTIEIGGDVDATVTLAAADLAGLEQHEQSLTFQSGDGVQSRQFSGPLLIDVLGLVTPTVDAEAKNPLLSFVVLATAGDGYRATVAWGEFDPGFGATPVLLALTEDGAPLADGPRLTVPGDVRGGRYVSGITTLTLIDTGAA